MTSDWTTRTFGFLFTKSKAVHYEAQEIVHFEFEDDVFLAAKQNERPDSRYWLLLGGLVVI